MRNGILFRLSAGLLALSSLSAAASAQTSPVFLTVSDLNIFRYPATPSNPQGEEIDQHISRVKEDSAFTTENFPYYDDDGSFDTVTNAYSLIYFNGKWSWTYYEVWGATNNWVTFEKTGGGPTGTYTRVAEYLENTESTASAITQVTVSISLGS